MADSDSVGVQVCVETLTGTPAHTLTEEKPCLSRSCIIPVLQLPSEGDYMNKQVWISCDLLLQMPGNKPLNHLRTSLLAVDTKSVYIGILVVICLPKLAAETRPKVYY